MPQEDYIKREIDKLGKVLAKALADLLGLKSQGKLADGIFITNQTLKTELNFELETLTALPENELLPFLAVTKKLSNAQMELIADLLFESTEEKDDHSLDKYKRALIIYKALTENEPVYSFNRHYKTEIITGILSKKPGH